MKKIIIFLPSLKGGGAERVLSDIANVIAIDGSLQINLVLVKKEGEYLKNISNRVTIIDLNSKSTGCTQSYLYFLLACNL